MKVIIACLNSKYVHASLSPWCLLAGVREFSENTYIKCFAALSEPKTISDFVVGLENDKIKMIMHLAGTINIE